MLIDTHTHFYDEWLLPDAEEAVSRALAAGVGKMIQADIDSKERPAMWEIGDRHPGVIFEMLGLYPGSVDENWRDEIDRLIAWRESILAREKGDGAGTPRSVGAIVAVGEIGLDYHEGKQFAAEQREAFRVQLELASAWDLPVNIHLRDAWEDFFSVIEDCRHLNIRGNLHCFSGSYEVFERACRSGDWSVGIGGVVTFKNASLAGTVARIPMEKILLETDAPYLAPTPYRGKRNESAYLPLIAEKVAQIKGLSFEETAQWTTRNAESLFQI